MPLEFRRRIRLVVCAASFSSAAFFLAALGLPARATLPARAAYVIGSLDGTIARVDLDAGTVVQAVLVTSSIPNRIVATADFAFAFVAASSGNRVDVFDLTAESGIASVPLPPGSNPWDCEVVGTRVFVTALLGDRVYEINPWSAAVVDTIETGVAPEGMCVAAGKLYVANTGFDFGTFIYSPGTVTVVDLASNDVVATIPVGLNPQECIATSNGEVHVVCTGDFFLTAGAISIVDPATDTVVESIPVDGYPGGAATNSAGLVHLNVTTTGFASHIWTYDAASRLFVNDGGNPLLPTFDFLGNVRVSADDLVVVPDFTQDLLLVEDPLAPGTPAAHLVGDGPVDALLVERDGSVSLVLSGLRATNEKDGVRLEWRANVTSELTAFVVDRAEPGRDYTRVARDLDVAADASWFDRDVAGGRTYIYRVGGVDVRGDVTWLPSITIARRDERADDRLAVAAAPNPFRVAATIRLAAPAGAAARLEIVDIAGRRVLTRDLGAVGGSGVQWVWDGRDARGEAVAPGAYFIRVEAGGQRAAARLLRVR